MGTLSIKSFRGEITEGNSKVIPKENCERMVNCIALENKFLTRAGCKKIGNAYSNFPIIASGGNLYVGGHKSGSPFSARINMIFNFKRVVGGKAVYVYSYPTLQAISGTPTGTAITNVTELQAMSIGGTYYLANDIDATGVTFNSIGTWANKFTGTFDGNGHTISNLYIYKTNLQLGRHGLFGAISGIVRNVGLIDVDISTYNSNTGAVIGDNSGTVSNCYSTGNIARRANLAGGIVGFNRATIENCYSTVSIIDSTSVHIGGLVGINSGTITNCYSRGAITSEAGTAGGLVGSNSGTPTYNDCFWDTETSGQATSAGGTGKTTKQMKTQAIFENWNFDTIWEML